MPRHPVLFAHFLLSSIIFSPCPGLVLVSQRIIDFLCRVSYICITALKTCPFILQIHLHLTLFTNFSQSSGNCERTTIRGGTTQGIFITEKLARIFAIGGGNIGVLLLIGAEGRCHTGLQGFLARYCTAKSDVHKKTLIPRLKSLGF